MRNDEKAISLDAIRRILRALRLAARQTQVKSGLSAAQLFVLRSLEDGQAASLAELAERTMTDRTSVSAVVDRLLASRLVTRRASTEDRRRAAIVITKSGRARLTRAPLPPTALLVAGLDRLPPIQLSALALGLHALTEAMGLADDPAGMLFEDGLPDDSRRLVARRRTK
jgi:DNA-binding MarR family transcriptional regulator